MIEHHKKQRTYDHIFLLITETFQSYKVEVQRKIDDTIIESRLYLLSLYEIYH